MTAFGKDNPMWKGGRSISSHGYVLIRVGRQHHLADVRGYAYEHRMVAEKVLGRRLRPYEKVHHIDENKKNNSPGNIAIINSNGQHFVFHRRVRGKQSPGETNSIILCACGCNTTLLKYDKSGRPRKYISGHNSRNRGKEG